MPAELSPTSALFGYKLDGLKSEHQNGKSNKMSPILERLPVAQKQPFENSHNLTISEVKTKEGRSAFWTIQSWKKKLVGNKK